MAVLPAETALAGGRSIQNSHDALEAIVDFNEQLKRLGAFAPRSCAGEGDNSFRVPRFAQDSCFNPEALYDILRAKGVEVIDLTPEFAGARLNGPLYCERDTHWNGRAIVLTAQKLPNG